MDFIEPVQGCSSDDGEFDDDVDGARREGRGGRLRASTLPAAFPASPVATPINFFTVESKGKSRQRWDFVLPGCSALGLRWQ